MHVRAVTQSHQPIDNTHNAYVYSTAIKQKLFEFLNLFFFKENYNNYGSFIYNTWYDIIIIL